MNHKARISKLERRYHPTAVLRIERVGNHELVHYGNLIVKILTGISMGDL